MLDGLKVTIPLSLAIRIRDALLRAKDDRVTLARVRSVAGEIEYVGRSSPEDDALLQALREAMGEAQHDARPSGPRRVDTVRSMPAVQIDPWPTFETKGSEDK